MEYVKVGKTADLVEKKVMKVAVKGKDILISNIKGEYFAIDNKCNHMGGSLVEGNIEGNKVICPKHGSVFDLKTGKVEEKGKLFFLKVKVKDQRKYPVKIEGNDIYIKVE